MFASKARTSDGIPGDSVLDALASSLSTVSQSLTSPAGSIFQIININIFLLLQVIIIQIIGKCLHTVPLKMIDKWKIVSSQQ
jgi:hypothetical protein